MFKTFIFFSIEQPVVEAPFSIGLAKKFVGVFL